MTIANDALGQSNHGHVHFVHYLARTVGKQVVGIRLSCLVLPCFQNERIFYRSPFISDIKNCGNHIPLFTFKDFLAAADLAIVLVKFCKLKEKYIYV